jgi:hypothetical protein
MTHLLLLVGFAGCFLQPKAAGSSTEVQLKQPWTITASEADRDLIPVLERYLSSGRTRIEEFFGHPFEKSFDVQVFPNRASFDRYFKERWQLPKTESWMVALGVADKLAVLSPRVWKKEATEHDPKDEIHFRELVAHELVHVYHGQHNPTRDFDGMDDLGWFVEGLAVYVSGQLEHGHKHAAQDAIGAGKAPHRLAEAWSGPYRYGVSGSMVQFIDKRYGRQTLWKLLPETKPDRVLKALNLTEKEFLRAWQECVVNGKSR